MVVLQQTALTPTLDITVLECDHVLGTCFLHTDGRLGIQAVKPDHQADFEALVRVEYVMQQKYAREAGKHYDPALFLHDLPRILRSYFAAQRVQTSQRVISPPFAFKQFDRDAIPTTPRRKRARA